MPKQVARRRVPSGCEEKGRQAAKEAKGMAVGNQTKKGVWGSAWQRPVCTTKNGHFRRSGRGLATAKWHQGAGDSAHPLGF